MRFAYHLQSKLGESKKFRKSSRNVESKVIAESFANPRINEFGPPKFFSSVTAPTLNKLQISIFYVPGRQVKI